MSSKLLELLAALATDHRLMERYLRNPQETAREYGLDEEDAQVLRSKDADAVYRAVKDSEAEEPSEAGVVYVPIGIPVYPAPYPMAPMSYPAPWPGYAYPYGQMPPPPAQGGFPFQGPQFAAPPPPPPPMSGPVSYRVTVVYVPWTPEFLPLMPHSGEAAKGGPPPPPKSTVVSYKVAGAFVPWTPEFLILAPFVASPAPEAAAAAPKPKPAPPPPPPKPPDSPPPHR